MNCDDIPEKNFKVKGSDPHGFDGDNGGIGCESNSSSRSNDNDNDKDSNDGKSDKQDKSNNEDEYDYEEDRKNACAGVDCDDSDECQPNGSGVRRIFQSVERRGNIIQNKSKIQLILRET